MKLRDAIVCTLAAGTLIAGCGKKDEGTKASKGGAAGSQVTGSQAGSAAAGSQAAGSQAAGPGSAVAPDAPAPKPVEVDKAAVQKVIDAWLAAQNAGDFADYQALYAEKMEGIKRVGARTWKFDRKGWLADRERMFKNPMTVAASKVTIEGGPRAAVVELVQSFKQGKFADEGTKRMVLARGKDGWRIAREEMLDSVVASLPVAGTAETSWLVVPLPDEVGTDGPYVVLDDQADASWGTGPLKGPLGADPMYATQGAGKAPGAAAWTARALAVYDAAGRRCPAKVRGLQLIGGGTPHFGTVQYWEGMDGEAPTPIAARAAEVFAMSGPKLLGSLSVEGDCGPPVVVVEAAAKPTVLATAPTDDARDKAALAAFRKLPGYKAIQSTFAGEYGGKGPWIENPTVSAWTDGARRIVVVAAKDGSGCGEFYGSLAAVFEDKGGKLKLLSSEDQGWLDISLVLDLDGDGKLELIGRPDDYSTAAAIFSAGDDGFSEERSVSFPYGDCPC